MLIGVISNTHGLSRAEALAALLGSNMITHACDAGRADVLDALNAIAAMAAELVTDVLVTAICRRGRPRELLHHSGRAGPYASEACQQLMVEHEVTRGPGRSGNEWGSAARRLAMTSFGNLRIPHDETTLAVAWMNRSADE
jgi:hypothetical protein